MIHWTKWLNNRNRFLKRESIFSDNEISPHLAGPDTVDPGVGDHLPRGDAQPVQLVIAPEPEKQDES